MTAAGIDWGGSSDRPPTDRERDFMAALDALLPGLDYWLHADDDGTPWLMVSLDLVEDDRITAVLRLDFDDRGMRGGWSPGDLNWDDGLRAETAGVEFRGPDGIEAAAGDPARAAAWFTGPKRGRWAL
ncbi:hypothetical protein M8542_39165 [Amycolatopsis sp. OK19-0408]|uniref:Uncharacterized protein n=1 Tax=Amycolatopsis iheyensis TaxID=2945988 RepID=A0A9X2NHH0_9PSEU|nr:hypothetical protein [Amycolatopsis iheyensis]MCR6488866.1 hypothetical protein [Amycolatopsis iheyensis]